MEELTPITRREVFLAKASGQEVETPTPITREEAFLDAIAKSGGGGGGSSGGGVLVIHETVEGTTHTLDKTWQEIHDADLPVFVIDNPDGGGTMRMWITFITASEMNYTVSIDGVEYHSVTADGYPAYSE